jgi:small GTP-binding protein
MQQERVFKLLVTGDLSTGKTTLVHKYAHGIYYTGTRPTVGVDFAVKTVRRDGELVTVQISDICGQERFRHMTRPFYDNAVGALIVADITNPLTLQAAKLWKRDLDAKVFIRGTLQPLPALLLLSKCDLGRCELTDAQLDDWCARHKFKGWLAASAQDGTNVNEAFEKMITLMIEATASQAGSEPAPAPVPTVVKLTATRPATTAATPHFFSQVAAAVRKRCAN